MSLRSTLANLPTRLTWKGSAKYWERRYASGGSSGAGSYGANAEFKASVINRLVAEHDIESVIEFGCGDGNQLRYAEYNRYLGLDVSATAVQRCIELFSTDESKSFILYSDQHFNDRGPWLHADATLSLEVIFHLVEDEVFHRYMKRLFAAADRHVIICASDREDLPRHPQERHRKFTDWVTAHEPEWELKDHVGSGAELVSEFFLYSQRSVSTAEAPR